MSRWDWTPLDCLKQLSCVGVRLSVTPDAKLLIDAPEDLEITDAMLRVIRKYKPGLIQILQSDSDSLEAPNPIQS